MRVVKQRMLEVMPGLEIFLDVDIAQLEIGDLEHYIAASDTVLVFCSQGYFQSTNCMRELNEAVHKQKPIIPMMEPDRNKGGMTVAEVWDQLVTKDLNLSSKLIARDVRTREIVELRNNRVSMQAKQRVKTSALLTEWLVAEGDKVSPGDPLCHILWRADGKPTSQPVKLVIDSNFTGTVVALRQIDAPHTEVQVGFSAGESFLMQWRDPHGVSIFNALFRNPPVEWNRLGAFQDVTLRLVASKLLPPLESTDKQSSFIEKSKRRSKESAPTAPTEEASDMGALPAAGSHDDAERLYIESEVWWQHREQVVVAPRKGSRLVRARYHLFISPNNAGAKAFIREINEVLAQQKGRSRGVVKFTTNVEELEHCESMLLYLNDVTWTSGSISQKLGVHLATAMKSCVPVILAHEMPDPTDDVTSLKARRASAVTKAQPSALGMMPNATFGTLDQFNRKPCDFFNFFNSTPDALLQCGIYHTVAVTLKGGPWRPTACALFIEKIASCKPYTTQPTTRQIKLLEAYIEDETALLNRQHDFDEDEELDDFAPLESDRSYAFDLADAESVPSPLPDTERISEGQEIAPSNAPDQSPSGEADGPMAGAPSFNIRSMFTAMTRSPGYGEEHPGFNKNPGILITWRCLKGARAVDDQSLKTLDA